MNVRFLMSCETAQRRRPGATSVGFTSRRVVIQPPRKYTTSCFVALLSSQAANVAPESVRTFSRAWMRMCRQTPPASRQLRSDPFRQPLIHLESSGTVYANLSERDPTLSRVSQDDGI